MPESDGQAHPEAAARNQLATVTGLRHTTLKSESDGPCTPGYFFNRIDLDRTCALWHTLAVSVRRLAYIGKRQSQSPDHDALSGWVGTVK